MTRESLPSLDDRLAVMAHKMTDAELRATIESIRGNPKRAGSQARRLNMGETLALAALMAVDSGRVVVVFGFKGTDDGSGY